MNTLMSTRVLIVDDNADVRMLLRIGVQLRAGMEVVGEAVNGVEAVEQASVVRPDIVILDREMPVAGGLEVLPRLRELCPAALIVLYTANADHDVRRAASSAGADEVRTKGAQAVDGLVGELEGLLLGDDEELVRLRVGPVDAHAARLWVTSTRGILDALLAAPHEVPASVDPALLTVFGDILDEWALVAEDEATFYWSAAAHVETLDALVRAWADLDQLDDATMARLGCSWSPPEARPFFDALTLGVVLALQRNDELQAIVPELPPDWAPGAADAAGAPGAAGAAGAAAC